jgi:hypothetical protein
MSEAEPRLLELLSQLELLENGREREGKALQALAQEATRGRSVLDSVHDAARAQAARQRELTASIQKLREPLERARLTALNAGLEGARKGDPVGKALVTMAEELRVLLARALDALDEHSSAVALSDSERERWVQELSLARELSSSLFERARELQALEAGFVPALERLGNALRRALGADPERAKMLARAAEQARALQASLHALGPDALDPELRPLLEPLAQRLTRESGG